MCVCWFYSDGDVSSSTAAVYSRAGALHLLHAGNRVLVPERCRRTTAPHESGHGGHSGRHHRSQRVWVPSLHFRPHETAQVKSKISHNRAFLCHFLLCHSTSVYLSCYVLVFFYTKPDSTYSNLLFSQVWRHHCRKHPEISPSILWEKEIAHGTQDSSAEIGPGELACISYKGFLKVMVGLISRVSAFFLSLQVLYNNKGYHSMPTYLNVLNNAILRANLPLSKGNPAAYGKNSILEWWP